MKARFYFAPGLVLVTALVLTGCGGPTRTELSGTVTLNGESLLFGEVVAFDEKSESVGVASIQDGSYKLTDLPRGSITLVVKTLTPEGNPVGVPPPPWKLKDGPAVTGEARKALMKNMPEHERKAHENARPVPLKYSTPATSDLKVSLDSGSSTFNIAMTGKGELPRMPAKR